MTVSTTPTVLIGTGKLARALWPRLEQAGFPPVAVHGRRTGPARNLAGKVAGCRVSTDPVRAAAAGRLVLLAVPDRELQPLARRLARGLGDEAASRTFLHHAGALGPGVLAALEQQGAGVGVLHPLQAFGGGPQAGAALAGSRARIEGNRRGRGVALRLARGLGLTPLRLPAELDDEQRAAYHAAGALVSNDLVALLAMGTDLLTTLGPSRKAALAALLPLARGTLEQAAARGDLHDALSGPVVRGDLPTVERHLRVLARLSDDHGEAHRRLSRRLLALRAERDRRGVEQMRRTLGRRRSAAGRRQGPGV